MARIGACELECDIRPDRVNPGRAGFGAVNLKGEQLSVIGARRVVRIALCSRRAAQLGVLCWALKG